MNNVFIGGIGAVKSKIEQKAIKDFIDYFGYAPSSVKVEGEYVYADRYFARIVNGKTLKKVYGVAWRLND